MIAADCEDKYHQIEREIAGVDDADQKRYEEAVRGIRSGNRRLPNRTGRPAGRF